MKENALYFLYHIASIVLGFFSTVILSKYFTVHDFGVYQLLVSFIGFVAIFRISGLDMILQRKILKNDLISLRLYRKIFYWPALIVWFLLLLFFYNIKVENSNIILLALSVFPFILYDRSTPVFLGTLNFKANRLFVLVNAAVVLSIAIFTVVNNLSLWGFLNVFVLAFAVVLIMKITVSKYILRKYNDPEVTFNDNEKKDIISTSSVNGYLSFSLIIERLMLGFLDPVLLAYFSIAQLLPKMVKENVKVLLTPTFYKWADISDVNILNKLQKHKFNFIIVGFFIYILIYLSAEYFINIFFGEKYIDAYLMVQLLSIPVILKVLDASVMSGIALLGKYSEYNKVNIIFPTIKILSAIPLIYMFSIWGAIIAIVTTEVIKSIYMYRLLTRLASSMPCKLE